MQLAQAVWCAPAALGEVVSSPGRVTCSLEVAWNGEGCSVHSSMWLVFCNLSSDTVAEVPESRTSRRGGTEQPETRSPVRKGVLWTGEVHGATRRRTRRDQRTQTGREVSCLMLAHLLCPSQTVVGSKHPPP